MGILGAVLIAIPVLALCWAMVVSVGWRDAIGIWLISSTAGAMIVVGAQLLKAALT